MRGKTLIYAGPTLYGCDVDNRENEVWLPPAGQGDILRGVLCHNPVQIVLIDGTFYHTLSVWVKEILYALADGVRVMGASSMGAIRASECWRYGMIGIGKIFESYRDGTVTDDAYVAMSYNPDTFEPLTTPPCGMSQKRIDALDAIDYARTTDSFYDVKAQSPVTMAQIRPLVAPVLDKILETESLVYG